MAYGLYVSGLHLDGGPYHSFGSFIKHETTLEGYASFLMQVLRIALVLWFVYKTKWFTPRKIQIKLKDGWYGIACLLLKMVLSTLAVIVCKLIGVDPQASTANQEALDSFMTHFQVFGFLYVVVLAPFIEEFVFRHAMLGRLFANHQRIGLHASALLFGCLHLVAGFSIMGFVIYVFMGYALGYVYLKTKRIEASIAVHLINNLLSAVISHFL